MKFQGQRINPTKFHKSQIKFYAILIVFSLFMILPIVYIFSHAFKPLSELYAFPPRFLVRRPTFDNFTELLRVTGSTGIPFSRYLFNSIFVTVVGVLLSVSFSSLSAYALSKLKFKGRKTLFEINTVALMFVPIAVAIPRYFVVASLGLIDNFFAHILPVITMPVAMFLVKQFIDQTPKELIESAKLDGASEMQVFLHIIVPIIKPALATVAMLAFQQIWNDASTSATYFDDDSMRTISFLFTSLSAAGGPQGQGIAAAGSLIMFIPNLILFIILQSQVMNTMAHSGIK